MKRQALMILTTLSFFVMLMATSAYAQSEMRCKVNIPFEFSVGWKILPAGEYTVSSLNRSLLEIRSVDRGTHQAFFAGSTRARETRNESSLVFHRYGDQYFLSKIWTAGEDTGRELFESRAEEELVWARSASIKNAPERQIVSIGARGSKR